jgi:hypothetical protein
MNEYLEKMSLNEAIEVATKYAEDIAIFASVDKYAVSKVCEVLLLELQAYKDKEEKIREYVTSYESISTIQGLNDITKNKSLDENTMIEMTNRYLEVHDKILQILNERR